MAGSPSRFSSKLPLTKACVPPVEIRIGRNFPAAHITSVTCVRARLLWRSLNEIDHEHQRHREEVLRCGHLNSVYQPYTKV